jgi:capsid protein
MQRNLFKREFCKPIYEAFLEESILKGRLDAPGFFDDIAVRAAWSGSDWIGTGMGQINPEVETKAAVLRINNQLSTHAKEVALYDGDDFDSMLPTCKRESEMIADAGLKKPGIVNEPNYPVDVEDEQ